MIAHYSFLWAQDDNVMTEQKCHFIFGDTLVMSSSPCELFFFFKIPAAAISCFVSVFLF